MKPSIKSALGEKDAFDFLCSLEAAYDYRAPSQFPGLTCEGRMAVGLRCFYQCFGSGGYAQAIAELHDWLPDIAQSLEAIGAERFASEVKRLLQLAAGRSLDVHDEDDAMTLEEIDDYHRAATLRDLPHLQDVPDCLRRFVETHADAF